MNKILIYSCVFFDQKYIDLINLLLKSYKLFGNSSNNIDYLIICNLEFQNKIQEIFNILNMNGKIWCLDLKTKFESGYSRLKIFDYHNINVYNKILYLDCNTLITNSISNLLDFHLDNKLYALQEGNTNYDFWGSQFFNKNPNCSAFTSGILLFNNNMIIKDLFSQILSHISNHLSSNLPIPVCLDQPFIVYHAVKNNLYDNQKLINIVVNNPTNFNGQSVSHFPGEPDHYEGKMVKMSNFMNNIMFSLNKNNETDTILINIKYKWENSTITFLKNGKMNVFGNEKGKYKFINKHLVKCNFDNREYLLKFNEDYSRFISVRKDDSKIIPIDKCKLKLIPKVIMQTAKNKPKKYIIDIINQKCNGWKYIHFIDSEIIQYFKENPIQEFPNIINKFNSFSKGQHKADLFRYYYLYLNGGIFLDSDAIFEEHIDNIIKSYDSVFVKSFMRNTHLFNGFICTYPKNPIIYDALKHAYETEDKILQNHYHYFCEELWRIYHRHNLPNMKIYQEHNKSHEGYGGSVILDDNGEKIISHYWKSKKIHIPTNTKTYNTKYGKVTLLNNDVYFITKFDKGKYWDEETLCYLRDNFISKGNILEIGGHSGTSTLFYSHIFDNLYVFEPQKKMYNLICKNMKDNNKQNVNIFNKALFCFNGEINMNDTDLDGVRKNEKITVLEEKNEKINYGGLSIGKNGETVKCITLDSLDIENITFIHCDAQGAEPFIFSKGKEFIKKHRPTILYENSDLYGKYLLNVIKESYPQYNEESNFNIKDYCVNILGGYICIDNFMNSGFDSLLIPYNKTDWNNYNTQEINEFDPTVLIGYDCPNPLIRVGPKSDRGYVIVDGFNYDHFLSCGIAGNIRFEVAFLDKYTHLKCDAFDGTINNFPSHNKNINWIKKNIGYINSEKITNLKPHIQNYKNIFLKMDIEGSEFNWIDSMTSEDLNCFSQIVIEIHWPFDKYRCKMLKKLNKTHYIVHIHGNNYCDRDIPKHLPSGRTYDGTLTINHSNYPTIKIPEVFEITYVRKNLFLDKLNKIEKKYPTSLDSPNNPNAQDIKFTITL